MQHKKKSPVEPVFYGAFARKNINHATRNIIPNIGENPKQNPENPRKYIDKSGEDK